jgi:polyisoprenoid-binding protein YceI
LNKKNIFNFKNEDMKKISLVLLAIALSAFTIIKSFNWQIKEGYDLKFSGTKVEGNFEDIKGTISFDENDLSNAKFDLNIKVESIATGNWLKNRHAKGDNWFDAEKYPTINFESSKFSKTTNGYLVSGFLTMHGVRKEITIPFTFSNAVFKSNFSVNRMDYKIGTMEGMSKKVSNEIKLEISIPVEKK